MKKERNKNPIQPVSGTKVPRFAGPSTFARLPELRDVKVVTLQLLEFRLMLAQVIDPEQDLVHKASGKHLDI